LNKSFIYMFLLDFTLVGKSFKYSHHGAKFYNS
jgi:hypothetical protein